MQTQNDTLTAKLQDTLLKLERSTVETEVCKAAKQETLAELKEARSDYKSLQTELIALAKAANKDK